MIQKKEKGGYLKKKPGLQIVPPQLQGQNNSVPSILTQNQNPKIYLNNSKESEIILWVKSIIYETLAVSIIQRSAFISIRTIEVTFLYVL